MGDVGMECSQIKNSVDRDGYHSVYDSLPKPYDLCNLVGRNGKMAKGWRTCSGNWDGYSIKRIDEVVAWKKLREIF